MEGTILNRKTKKYYHSGRWEENKFYEYASSDEELDEEEREAKKWSWSCCQNAEKKSEGCIPVVVDKDRWILSSYT